MLSLDLWIHRFGWKIGIEDGVEKILGHSLNDLMTLGGQFARTCTLENGVVRGYVVGAGSMGCSMAYVVGSRCLVADDMNGIGWYHSAVRCRSVLELDWWDGADWPSRWD